MRQFVISFKLTQLARDPVDKLIPTGSDSRQRKQVIKATDLKLDF